MCSKRKIVGGVAFGLSLMAQAGYVTIGDAGNKADKNGHGSVGYEYKISTHEVNLTEFAKAVEADSRVGNGNENYWNDGVRRVGEKGPASMVSWYEAAKYCNWMTSGNAYKGAYGFDKDGKLTSVMSRKEILDSGSLYYVLPTEDEWYKAAYFRGPLGSDLWSLYANGTDEAPKAGKEGSNYNNVLKEPNCTWEIGGALEQNDTYNMMGNVWEWLEGDPLASGGEGFFRGGSYIDEEGNIT